LNENLPFARLSAEKRFLVVILSSAFFGFLVGVAHSTWQVVAESSQVLAGIAKYPTANPFYIYHLKSWTILNQLGALFLYLGGTEKILSMVVSGMMGMVYFMGFSVFVFALCQNSLFALLTPFIMHFLDLDTDFGVTYPFQITDSMHTYGVIGQGFAFLVIALFCAKKFKAGGFLLGISLSIHPAIGGFLCLTLFLGFCWSYKSHLSSFFVALKYFFLGTLLTALSFYFYSEFSEQIPVISDSLAADYRYISAKYWSHHRGPISTLSIGILIGIVSFLFISILILFFKENVPEHTHFPLRVLMVAGTIGLVGCLTTFFPPDIFHPLVTAVMPSRWLNIDIIGFIPLFVGISGWYKKNTWVQVNLVIFISVLALILTFHPPSNWGRFVLGILIFSSFSLIILLKNLFGIVNLLNRLQFNANSPRKLALTILFLISIGMGGESINAWGTHKARLLNWNNDPMFKKMHEKQGYILLDPRLALPIQLYTQKPVLFASSLSSVSYIPVIGPLVESIMKDIFNEDLFNPSEEAKKSRGIPVDIVKSLWETRTAGEWKKIGENFGIVTIITFSDWKLQLPIIYGPEKKSLNSLNTTHHNTIKEYLIYQVS